MNLINKRKSSKSAYFNVNFFIKASKGRIISWRSTPAIVGLFNFSELINSVICRTAFEEIASRLTIKDSFSRFGAVDRTYLICRNSRNSWSSPSNLSSIDCKLSIMLFPNIYKSVLLYVRIFCTRTLNGLILSTIFIAFTIILIFSLLVLWNVSRLSYIIIVSHLVETWSALVSTKAKCITVF